MGLSSIVKRLDKYQNRLDKGRADKIKLEHVEKAISKLKAKKAQLAIDLSETKKPDKRKRLKEKLKNIDTQIDKAEWLAKKI